MHRTTVLIVDDVEMNRVLLQEMFLSEYKTLLAEDADQAVALLKEYGESIAVVLLDIVMPGKNGYYVLDVMNRLGLLSRIPVVVITAENGIANEMHVFNLGASEVIFKPFTPSVVVCRVQNVIRTHRDREHLKSVILSQEQQIIDSHEVMLHALSSILQHRNMESTHHMYCISLLSRILLQGMDEDYPVLALNERTVDLISKAAMLHDIGKISIPEAILNKPGKLTPEEYGIMKTHSERGHQILGKFQSIGSETFLNFAKEICLHHHERWDGGGYPDQLREHQIPLSAQIVSLVDVYDALVNSRVYKPPFTHEEAVQMILNGECGAFSPAMLACFSRIHERFRQAETKTLTEIESLHDRFIINELAIKLETPAQESQDDRFALFSDFTEKLPCPTLLTRSDPEGTLLRVNTQFCDLVGYSQEELSARFGNRYAGLLAPDAARPKQSDAPGQPQEGVYRLCRKDGSTVRVLERTLYDPDTQTCCAVLTNLDAVS